MIPLASMAIAGCLAVAAGSDHVVAGELAGESAAFAGLAPDTPVLLAPDPGVTRVVHPPELRSLADRFHLPFVPEESICMVRPVAPLDPARLLNAMRKHLPEARIEIAEFSRWKAPGGEIEFPREGLRPAPGGGFWSGYVLYGGGRKFPIWARVKVLVTVTRTVPTALVQPGRPIEAAGLRAETREEFPTSGVFAESVAEVAGRLARRAIPAGTPIRLGWLEEPKDVVRGETVQVEVRNGGAVLALEAQAQASGSAGDTIPLLNPVSKKRFLARVEGKGRVSVSGGGNP